MIKVNMFNSNLNYRSNAAKTGSFVMNGIFWVQWQIIKQIQWEKSDVKIERDLPILELRLLFGFAKVTVGKNNFSCINEQIRLLIDETRI